MRKLKSMLLMLLCAACLLSLPGCRMRILESPIADVVLEDLPMPQEESPEPTPTPKPESTPTPTPTTPPETTPNPNGPTAPSRDDKQTTPDSNVTIITPGQGNQVEKSKEKITVTLDANGGTCSRESVEVRPGTVYGSLPDAKRAGRSFTGWYFSRSGGTRVTENTIVTLSEDHTLYAHWSEAAAHTLTLDPQGGRLLRSELTRSVYPGDAYGALPAPSRPGYAFDGWFTEAGGGELVAPEAIVAEGEDETLYAHWTYDPFAYWSFVLQNTNEALYACQKVSAYLEYDTDHITPGYSPLLAGTTVFNVAENRGGGEVDDEWVNEKNPNVIVKCISDMSRAADAYSAMQARFPDRRILVVPAAAENGSAEQQLYLKLCFAKTLYPDWYLDVDLATVASELGVGGSLYGS